MTDGASSCLIFGLHGGGPGKTRIKDERMTPIFGTEGVDLRQCCLRIKRLHGTCGVFRRH
jgi:hypothetical protein